MSHRWGIRELDDRLRSEPDVVRLDDANDPTAERLDDTVLRYGLRSSEGIAATAVVRFGSPGSGSVGTATGTSTAAAPGAPAFVALDTSSTFDAAARALVAALVDACRRAGVDEARARCAHDDRVARRFWQTLGFLPHAPDEDGQQPHRRRLSALPADRRIRSVPDDLLEGPFEGQRATLLFVVRAGRVLLIHKKRGHGAGRINGPGGKCEPGETPRACAIREVREELLIDVDEPTWRGELRFLDSTGTAIHGFVYTAGDFEGTPTETDEARPQWFDLGRVPYARMWEDDRMWLPWVLEGQGIHAGFLTDAERVVAGRLRLGAQPEPR